MKLVYVAGPYRAKTKLGVILNIIRARRVAKELWKIGYAVVCPHMNSALMDGIVAADTFLTGDIEILKHCDVLVLQGKWERSAGTLKEIKIAKQKRIPIYEWKRHRKYLKCKLCLCNTCLQQRDVCSKPCWYKDTCSKYAPVMNCNNYLKSKQYSEKNIDRCLSCGELVPEGRQVCYKCENFYEGQDWD